MPLLPPVIRTVFPASRRSIQPPFAGFAATSASSSRAQEPAVGKVIYHIPPGLRVARLHPHPGSDARRDRGERAVAINVLAQEEESVALQFARPDAKSSPQRIREDRDSAASCARNGGRAMLVIYHR